MITPLEFLSKFTRREVVPTLTRDEESEMHQFHNFPDDEHGCYPENNYERFGILESLRRKGYIYQVRETCKMVYYKLTPKHQI